MLQFDTQPEDTTIIIICFYVRTFEAQCKSTIETSVLTFNLLVLSIVFLCVGRI